MTDKHLDMLVYKLQNVAQANIVLNCVVLQTAFRKYENKGQKMWANKTVINSSIFV